MAGLTYFITRGIGAQITKGLKMKNMKIVNGLFLTLGFLVPMSAMAEMDVMTCATANHKTIVQIATDYDGSVDDLYNKNDLPLNGVIRVMKLNGKTQAYSLVKLIGQISVSAKGPYEELAGGNLKVFISAPASQSPSELTIGGKDLALNCD